MGTRPSYTSLESASFPMATDIGSEAFEDNSSLERVYIPMVTSIGHWAFGYTTPTTSPPNLVITMEPQAPDLGEDIFYNNPARTVPVLIPADATGFDAAWAASFRGSFCG